MNENIDRVHSSGVGGRGAEKGGGRVFRLGTAVGGVDCWLDFFRSGRTAHWNLPAWRRWPPLPVPRRKLTSAQPPRASDWRQKKSAALPSSIVTVWPSSVVCRWMKFRCEWQPIDGVDRTVPFRSNWMKNSSQVDTQWNEWQNGLVEFKTVSTISFIPQNEFLQNLVDAVNVT